VGNGVDWPPAWNLWAGADWVNTAVSVNAIASAALAAGAHVRKNKPREFHLWRIGSTSQLSAATKLSNGRAHLKIWKKEARGPCFSRTLDEVVWEKSRVSSPRTPNRSSRLHLPVRQ